MKVVNNGKLTVTIKNNQLMAFEDLTLEPIPVIQKGNKVYLPSRIVAALTNAEPKWDKANQTLTLQKSDSSKLTFTAASQSVWSEKDETYLELGAIQSKFPAFQWNYKDGTLTLQIG
ncbi:stalk domain-containing protein [Paenibacillus sp. GCM10027629]|uniref:stalk domain-containing protein n=1 Tax=Paenibacillus sp. GCM10027629 TaxID=3273414 RepID=UPI00362E4ECD